VARDEVKKPRRAGAPVRERCRALRSVTLLVRVGGPHRSPPQTGRRGREVGPMAEGWKALEGGKARRASAAGQASTTCLRYGLAE
jgi:hypothetical protein